MLDSIKNWIDEKKKHKWFKTVVMVILFIIISITVNVIEKKENSGSTEPSAAAESADNEEAEEKTGFHIGIGHIVMLVVFTAAYGIDRIIVYKNKLEDDKKYSNNEED